MRDSCHIHGTYLHYFNNHSHRLISSRWGINSCRHLENKINVRRKRKRVRWQRSTSRHHELNFDDGKSFLILHSKPLISRDINAISIVFSPTSIKTRTTQQQVEIFHLKRIPEVTTTGNIYSTDRISLAHKNPLTSVSSPHIIFPLHSRSRAYLNWVIKKHKARIFPCLLFNILKQHA